MGVEERQELSFVLSAGEDRRSPGSDWPFLWFGGLVLAFVPVVTGRIWLIR
jgi:hypothetical protein